MNLSSNSHPATLFQQNASLFMIEHNLAVDPSNCDFDVPFACNIVN